MRKPYFGSVYGAIARRLNEGEGIVVSRVSDNLLQHVLPLEQELPLAMRTRRRPCFIKDVYLTLSASKEEDSADDMMPR